MDGPAKKRRHGEKQAFEAQGRIDTIVLENFKSYEGVHEIGPFDKFTCIIGPNGSGKSNIMDAISFCLGINAKHLRGDRLRDLIYKKEHEAADSNRRKASVTIVFRTGQGAVLHFSRSVDYRGIGTYRCGQVGRVKVVGHDEFTKLLAEHRIYVKARNFLVFQGDVMDLARRQGQELARILETISGSEQLKDEYVRLKRELELAQERARMHFQHRREAETAVAALEKQRAEVERYKELKAKRSRLAAESVLYRLLIVHNEEAGVRGEAESVRREFQAVDGEMKAFANRAGELATTRQLLSEEVDKASSAHAVMMSNLNQIRPELANCKRQVLHWGKKLAEAEASLAAERAKLDGLRGDVERARERRAEAEAVLHRLRAAKPPPLVSMSPVQLLEYEQALGRCEAAGGAARDRLADCEARAERLERELASSRQEVEDVRERCKRLVLRLEEFSQKKENLQLEVDSYMAEVKQKQKAAEKLKQELDKFQSYKELLAQDRREQRLSAEAARGRRERLAVLKAKASIAEGLREHFPLTVMGRVSEVVLPAQRRFDRALQTALGAFADAFIVTDTAAGIQCIRHLKAMEISMDTFLPLDRLEPPKADPWHLLTQKSQTRRMATACAQHNEKFFERNPRWQAEGPGHVDRVLESLLHGSIVVDDMQEAQRLAFADAPARKLQPKVVTLQGEVISPDGNMSVESNFMAPQVEFGSTEELEAIDKEVAKLHEIEKDLATTTEKIGMQERQHADALREGQQLDAAVAAARRRAEQLRGTEKQDQERLGELREFAAAMEAEIKKREEELSDLERTKDVLEADLLKQGRRHFAKLNQELGVRDVRELKQREQKQLRAWRLSFRAEGEKVRALLAEEKEIEQSSRGSAKLDALQREIEQYRLDIDRGEGRREALEQQEAARSKQAETSAEKLEDARQRREQLDSEIKVSRAEVARLKPQAEDLKRKVRRVNEKLRDLLISYCSILAQSREKMVNVPFTDPTTLENLASLLPDREFEARPLQDLEAVCSRLQVDFSSLPEHRREAARARKAHETPTIDAEYEAQIANLTRELQGLSPNMRAVDEFAEESKKLQEVRRLAEEVAQETQRLSREFEAVKAERAARFHRCYRHVEAQVQPFYRALTSYDGYEGGAAYLDLDDAEEPYNGGIVFTACPPGKRFFPMELLSGGEKSMASLSLLFAMHSFQPPPFMILDEVDAPFDRKNTSSLVRCLQQMDFQCLVISLKDTFFSHSDSIVGVFKDRESQCSGHLLLPLKKLGAQCETARGPAFATALSDDDGEG